MELTPEILTEILALKEGEEYWIKSFMDGGAYLVRYDKETFSLYEVPIYGGEPRYYKMYHFLILERAFLDAAQWT